MYSLKFEQGLILVSSDYKISFYVMQLPKLMTLAHFKNTLKTIGCVIYLGQTSNFIIFMQ